MTMKWTFARSSASEGISLIVIEKHGFEVNISESTNKISLVHSLN